MMRTPEIRGRGVRAAAGNRIDLDGVGKQYRVGDVEVTALAGVDLHVDEASFVVILGPPAAARRRCST